MPPRVAARFEARIDRTDTCWLWTGAINSRGYGSIGWGGKSYLAHRVSHVIHIGPIAPGLQVDHLCRVRRCVRPEHLEAVTPTVNVARAPRRPRHSAGRPRHSGGTHFALPRPPPTLQWGDPIVYDGEEGMVLRSSNTRVSIVFANRVTNRVAYDLPRRDVESAA